MRLPEGPGTRESTLQSEAEEADRTTERALVFANIANILLPIGVIGAAIGTYLVLTAGPTDDGGFEVDAVLPAFVPT